MICPKVFTAEFAKLFPYLKVGLSQSVSCGKEDTKSSWAERFLSLAEEIRQQGSHLIPVIYADFHSCVPSPQRSACHRSEGRHRILAHRYVHQIGTQFNGLAEYFRTANDSESSQGLWLRARLCRQPENWSISLYLRPPARRRSRCVVPSVPAIAPLGIYRPRSPNGANGCGAMPNIHPRHPPIRFDNWCYYLHSRIYQIAFVFHT